MMKGEGKSYSRIWREKLRRWTSYWGHSKFYFCKLNIEFDLTSYLERKDNKYETGIGYDVHHGGWTRFNNWGVKIPYEKGLLGHSDADVLTPCTMDSLLGAAALGDIGRHFPDTDEKYKGVSSLDLLKEVRKLIEDKQYVIENIDAIIVAQAPKMAIYIPTMIKNIASVLAIEEDQINIKATTEEGLGVTGDGRE